MTEGLGKYRRRYKEGDVLLREGESGSELYLLEKGVFNIVIQGKTVDTVDASKTQDFLGEVAAILGTPRTATVVAATDGVALCLPDIELESVLKGSPTLGIKLVRSLCKKLAGNASALAAAQAQNDSILKSGSTDVSLRNYMKGVLGLMEKASEQDAGGVTEVLDYFLRTNPWSIQHGNTDRLLDAATQEQTGIDMSGGDLEEILRADMPPEEGSE